MSDDEIAQSSGRQISRVVPDATALKALAHPVRMRLLGLLRMDGPATATLLGQRLGLNSGATSYHLRQLAQHGFIEDAPGPSRRERWWRASHETTSVLGGAAEGEALDLRLAFTQAALSWQVSQMQGAIEDHPKLPQAWRKASTASDLTIPLRAEEAEALIGRIMELLWEAMRGAPALSDPPQEERRPFTVMLHAFPYPGRVPPVDETG